MMQVTLRFFASIREAVGQSSESFQTTATNVSELRDALIARGAPYADALGRGKSVRIALDQTMCDESVLLRDGAEAAFFPPVTGG